MAPGKRRSKRRINPWLVAIPVALVGTGVAFFLLRGDGGPAPKPRPKPQPPFAFSPTSVEFVPVTEGAVPDEGDESATAVTEVLSDVYDAGFVTKKRWEGGRFSAVLKRFDEKARAQAAADLAELTVGPQARQLKSVEPGASVLELSFMVDKGKPVAVIAETSFQGSGKLRAGGDLAITHAGTFYLELIEDEWRIVGYRVKGSLDSGATQPTPEAT